MVRPRRENKVLTEEQALRKQIQEKAVLLSELDMMIMDYQRERQDLLMEIRRLREKLWVLKAKEDGEEKALLLSDLEVVLEECQRKRRELLQDLRALKERLWDLRDRPPEQ